MRRPAVTEFFKAEGGVFIIVVRGGGVWERVDAGVWRLMWLEGSLQSLEPVEPPMARSEDWDFMGGSAVFGFLAL